MQMMNRTILVSSLIAVSCFAAGMACQLWLGTNPADLGAAAAQPSDGNETSSRSASQSVELNEQQLAAVKVEPVGEAVFAVEKSAVGSIDFNEDMTVQVFTPYPGKIIDLFAKVGDEVATGQILFTVDSPDLLAADSNLISAAGVHEFTSRALERLKVLYQSRAVAQKELEQAISVRSAGAHRQECQTAHRLSPRLGW
jgi:membrane fusion protein, heavy metal efflux system